MRLLQGLDVAGSNVDFASAAEYNMDLLLEFFEVLYLDLDIIRDVIGYVFGEGWFNPC
jgi:hypothetical protein